MNIFSKNIFILALLATYALLPSNKSIIAGEAYIINSSTQGVPNATANSFVHKIVTSGSDCDATDCSALANRAIGKFQDDTYFSTTNTTLNPTFFTEKDTSSPNSGFQLHRGASAFTDPLLTSADSNYYLSESLPASWVDDLTSLGASLPTTAHASSVREQGIDQMVLNFVEDLATNKAFAQQLKSQLEFGSSLDLATGEIVEDNSCKADVSTCKTFIEQRLTGGDKDTSGSHSLGYAFQQSFVAMSGANATATTSINEGTVIAGVNAAGNNVRGIAQDIEQHQNNYLYSCINCNLRYDNSSSSITAYDRSFSEISGKAVMQDWLVDAPSITSIISASNATQTTW